MKREILVDARNLAPPEPMEHVLLALDELCHGEYVRFLAPREPTPLYPILHQKGYHYRARLLIDRSHEVLIYPEEP